jgi:hypothetical protein
MINHTEHSMSFAINPSLTHIDTPESNILEIYRSKGEIQLSDTRFRGHPCEAFICVSRVEKKVTACVALLETGMNSIFVYTSDFSAEQSPDYPKVLAEAQEFTTSFGFTMEKVNLDFSPAMREVIIKGLKVMSPPKKKAKLRSLNPITHLEPAAPEPPAPLPAAAYEKSSSDPTELQSLIAELSSARAVIEKITRENLALKQSASREISTLKSSLEKAAESRRICEENLSKEIETLKKAKLATDARQQETMVATLKSELDAAALKAKNIEKTLSAEIAALNEKITGLESEKQNLEHELAAEKSSSLEKISRLTAENESINSLLSSEKLAAADKIASLAFIETSWRESQQREEDLCRNIDTMNEQISHLEEDLEKHRLKEDREDALQLKVASLEKQLEASKEEIRQLTGITTGQTALEVELKGLTEAKSDVEAEYIRMANEVMGKEAEMLEALNAADAEIVRLSRELELQQKVAEMETTALRNELKQMLRSGAATLNRVDPVKPLETTVAVSSPLSNAQNIVPIEPESLTTAITEAVHSSDLAAEPHPDIVPLEDDTPDGPVVGDPEITRGLINEFGSFCSSSGHSATEFKIDSGISSIEYSDPAEILAILYSSNTVQAVPDSSKIQRCKGYVIATKKDGEYRAYVAWYLTESKKVVICTPEQQPADAEECTQILQDAVSYFEIVGFMMELEDLGNTIKSYSRAIKKVPALSKK